MIGGIRLVFVGTTILLLGPQVAQHGAPPQSGGSWTFDSATYRQARTVLLSLPATYATGQARYPAIYFTDASATRMQFLRGIVGFLADIEKMPDVILVGIVHPDRNADLLVSPPSGAASTPPGGADQLIRFLQQELIPRVDAAYRTLPSRLYIGHSLGGSFGLYAMLRAPELFHGQIAVDPALWRQPSLVEDLPGMLDRTPGLVRSLHVSQTGSMSDAQLFDVFDKRMRQVKSPGIRYSFQRLPASVGHDLAILPTVYEGLTKLFEAYAPPADNDLSFETFRSQLARPILGALYEPTEGKVREFGLTKFHQKRYEDAIRAFQWAHAINPQSLSTLERLTDICHQAGRTREALEYADEAIELATRVGSPNLNRYLANKKALLDLMSRK